MSVYIRDQMIVINNKKHRNSFTLFTYSLCTVLEERDDGEKEVIHNLKELSA